MPVATTTPAATVGAGSADVTGDYTAAIVNAFYTQVRSKSFRVKETTVQTNGAAFTTTTEMLLPDRAHSIDELYAGAGHPNRIDEFIQIDTDSYSRLLDGSPDHMTWQHEVRDF